MIGEEAFLIEPGPWPYQHVGGIDFITNHVGTTMIIQQTLAEEVRLTFWQELRLLLFDRRRGTVRIVVTFDQALALSRELQRAASNGSIRKSLLIS